MEIFAKIFSESIVIKTGEISVSYDYYDLADNQFCKKSLSI